MFSVIENSVNLDAVNLDALYLVKPIFGKYFCYFDSNHVAALLQLHFEANRVQVRERINMMKYGNTEADKLNLAFHFWKMKT